MTSEQRWANYSLRAESNTFTRLPAVTQKPKTLTISYRGGIDVEPSGCLSTAPHAVVPTLMKEYYYILLCQLMY